jgi:hypothetical protein
MMQQTQVQLRQSEWPTNRLDGTVMWGPRQVEVTDLVIGMLVQAPRGRLDCSLRELAAAVGSDVDTVRGAVAALDPTDYRLSVAIRGVPAEEPFTMLWAPVAGVVNLLIDWDLLALDISLGELAEWLGVPLGATRRALSWLAVTPGVVVRAQGDDTPTVSIALSLERCPLTA